MSTFSSWGPTADNRTKPELVAFGDATVIVSVYDDTSYVTGQGTSYSTPLVAGAAALILQAHPDWGPMQVREALTSTSSNRKQANNRIGWGIPDVIAAMNYPVNTTSFIDNCVYGVLYNNNCICYEGYGGNLCDSVISGCGLWNCHYGYCNAGSCICYDGYTGHDCLTASSPKIMPALLLLSIISLLLVLLI